MTSMHIHNVCMCVLFVCRFRDLALRSLQEQERHLEQQLRENIHTLDKSQSQLSVCVCLCVTVCLSVRLYVCMICLHNICTYNNHSAHNVTDG